MLFSDFMITLWAEDLHPIKFKPRAEVELFKNRYLRFDTKSGDAVLSV